MSLEGPNGPAEIVKDKYDRSVIFSSEAMRAVDAMQEALNESIYEPPQMDIRWSGLAAPNLPPIPEMPELPQAAIDTFGSAPSTLTATLGDVEIDDFSVAPPALEFGSAPTLTIGQAPTLPAMREVELPDAPTVDLPAVPEFLQLTTHSFGGLDLHERWLDKLEDIPELTLVEPAPFSHHAGARYGSQLLDNLKALLNARIHGGTGLSADVEQRLWDRARDRETVLALAREQDAARAAEALGFPLPSGVLTAQLADARREYQDKLSGLSRDIAIKQAELEQENVKAAVQSAIQLESTLIDDYHKYAQLAFEIAKAAADNAIQANNAALDRFKALLAGYQAYAGAYDTMIRAELAKVEVFKTLLQAEQVKADINKSLVDRYRAEIDGRMAVVEIYKARVGAAQTLVSLEGTRIQAGGEQVKAFVATINAETAKADLYKTMVSAESAKQEAYGSQVRAYAAKVGAQADRARANVSAYQAMIAAKGLEWDGWKARLQASVSAAEIAARNSSIAIDGYRAGAAAAEAQAGSYMRRWEADIRHYEASRTMVYNMAKANNDWIVHANDARMEAAKVGLTTNSQRLASAWAMVSANAGISASINESRQL